MRKLVWLICAVMLAFVVYMPRGYAESVPAGEAKIVSLASSAAPRNMSMEITSDQFGKFAELQKIVPEKGGTAAPGLYDAPSYSQIGTPYYWQKTEVWCWAACIQMFLSYYGFTTSQEAIVSGIYGWPVASAANDEQIRVALNQWLNPLFNINISYFMGRPDDLFIIEKIRNRLPVIVSYFPTPNSQMRHAVLLTGVDFSDNNRINAVIVRDPYPTPENINNLGRNVYDRSFIEKISACWYIE